MRSGGGCLGLAVLLLLGATAAARAEDQRSPCDIHYPSDTRVEWSCGRLRPGETLERRFGARWIDVARFNRIDRRHARPGVRLRMPTRPEDLAGFTPMPPVYPGAAEESRFVLVDVAEQFLGAYERGRLVFSAPAAVGDDAHPTPAGDFRITLADPRHVSSLYTIEHTDVPYPMTWALRFHVSPAGVAWWIHGRDVPGYPASHGCVGLYDEAMQRRVYGEPAVPVLDDARRLYAWVVGAADGAGGPLPRGPRVRILGPATASDGEHAGCR